MNHARLLSQEHRYPVHGRIQAGAQQRYLGTGILAVVAGLLHCQLIAQAGLIAPLGQLVGLALGLEVVFRHGNPVLVDADVEIVQSHFRQQRDQDVAQALPACLQVTFRCLDGAANAAEKIQFPPGIEARGEEVAAGVGSGIGDGPTPGGGSGAVERRHEVGRGDAPAGARFPNSSLCHLQIKVAGNGTVDQSRQDRIIECGPPRRQGLNIPFRGRRIPIEPGIPVPVNRDLGAHIVGSHFHTPGKDHDQEHA